MEFRINPNEDPCMDLVLDTLTIAIGDRFATQPPNTICVTFSDTEGLDVLGTSIEIEEDMEYPGTYYLTFRKD